MQLFKYTYYSAQSLLLCMEFNQYIKVTLPKRNVKKSLQIRPEELWILKLHINIHKNNLNLLYFYLIICLLILSM